MKSISTNGIYISERRLRPLMGTLCSIEVRGPADSIQAAVSQAFAAMVQIERCMHPTRATSDLARLNDSTRQLKIDPALWEVLATARRIHKLSHGVFDPCLPLREGKLSDVELLPDSTAICHAPVALDLGGIAKGYAIDRAVDSLFALGCVSGIVNAGGDLRVFGEQPQPITIRAKDRHSVTVSLQAAALAVSEVDVLNHPVEHQGYYLRDRDCAPAYRHVAVLAEQAMIADALTKCAMFCSPTDTETLFRVLNAKLVLNFSVRDAVSSERPPPR